MMELMMLSGGVLVLPALAFITSLRLRPGAYLKAYNWYLRRRLGLVVRYSQSGSYRFCYSSRGTPGGATPSLLLLHGFSVSKDMWLSLVKHFPRSQHVVCVDMPGHEGTSRTGAEDYSIQGQVGRINQFVQSIGLDKRPFHLVGGSMGGCVAGVYAAHYPAHLSSITLVCPGGLVYPTETEFISRLNKIQKTQQVESFPLIATTLQEMEDILKLCYYNPPNLPRLLLRGLLDNSIPNIGFYKELFMEIFGEKSLHLLQENLHLITSPVQVIWGTEDKLLDVSGATVLQESLPNCQVTLLDNCGHAVTADQPKKTAKLIMDFLSEQEVNGENTKKLS
ncbi:monoacylglycerol lipase abhd6-B-like [Sebastes umbrosus]|uniref:monoacylglycerol lipase abhd6-B-like n=1 Tax=Sebastes umbrosus TaxID=72105 RepID=UPI00189D776E|nr:monoacylglycerol lipase abhd6-B-like [Sebastes umbrosus]